eukprot:6460957-Amphidinium_carterae.1
MACPLTGNKRDRKTRLDFAAHTKYSARLRDPDTPSQQELSPTTVHDLRQQQELQSANLALQTPAARRSSAHPFGHRHSLLALCHPASTQLNSNSPISLSHEKIGRRT